MNGSLRYIVVFFILSFSAAAGAQEKYPDKLYPRSETWSVQCKVLRVADKTVLVQFPGQEKYTEIQRTSLKMIEYEDGSRIIFNAYGQIEGETTAFKTVVVDEVLNPGILRLKGGEEIVLNGIDFTLPNDSLGIFYYHTCIEYMRSLLKNNPVQFQYDLARRDEFGRQLVYAVLPGGLLLNADIIRKGFCKTDISRPLIYLEDFKSLEIEARTARRGIWSKK